MNKARNSLFIAMAAATTATFLPHSIQAVPLPPGGSTPVVPAGVLPASAVLDTVTAPFSLVNNLAQVTMTGTVTTTVYGPSPLFPGDPFDGLIFTYDINVTASEPDEHLGRITTVEWAGFLADVSQVAPGELAQSADRIASGGNIAFSFFTSGAAQLQAGESSALLIIRSDAEAYKVSAVNLLDGGVDSVPSFAPAVVGVPDGGTTAVLLGLGVLGMTTLRRKLS